MCLRKRSLIGTQRKEYRKRAGAEAIISLIELASLCMNMLGLANQFNLKDIIKPRFLLLDLFLQLLIGSPLDELIQCCNVGLPIKEVVEDSLGLGAVPFGSTTCTAP